MIEWPDRMSEQELAKSKEFALAKDLFVENFFWRDGEYKCNLEIYENHNIRKQKDFRFLVPKTEIAFLRTSLENLDTFLLKVVATNQQMAINRPSRSISILES